MNVNNNEDSKLTPSQRIDKSRRAFSKTGVITPVIMTLTSKTALGGYYQCSVSGMQSGNQSSHPGQVNCKVGYSPEQWKGFAIVASNGIKQWLDVGVNPFSIKMEDTTKKVSYQNEWKFGSDSTANWEVIHQAIYNKFNSSTASATPFNSLFGGAISKPVWDILDETTDSLERHAIAGYLNASLNLITKEFNDIYDIIIPTYIVDIYNNPTLPVDKKLQYFLLIHQ